MAKNKAIKNDERKENKLGNRITFLLVLVVLVSIPFIVEYRDEKLTNYKLVKGVVVKHSMMIDVGYPEIVCRVTINGEERLINYSTNDLKVSIGVSVEKDIKKIAKATVVNSAISVGAKSATTKIKASSSDEALKAAKKTANTAQIGVKKATTQVAKKPNSINASVALDKAKSVALEARKTEVRTQMANSTVNKVLTVTVANNQKLGEKVVEKTIKTVTQKVVNDGKK